VGALKLAMNMPAENWKKLRDLEPRADDGRHELKKAA
jgi:hypothetical protein